MKFTPKLTALFIAMSLANMANGEELDEIQVTTQIDSSSTNPLSDAPKPNDIIMDKPKLRRTASTLGNALNGELGVHSSQFGGGASAPIIRGQEGVRLKVLQNGLDVVDMSQLSPDHAIAADTLLANKVEIVRGASTLLYSTASQAGVINVTDNRIPTEVPEKGYAVDAGIRYNSNSREKVENAAFSLGLGKHIVIRAEGLNRDADNYRVPTLQFNDQTVNQLPNSFNKSRVGVLGLSLVGERGYVGVAYSERHDKYGLVGHNHKFDSCYGHIIDPLNQYFVNRYYLHPYPHLMNDSDVREGAHFDCGSGHEMTNTPSHSHPFGHNIVGGPFIDMNLKRYEVRAELKDPMPYIEKIRANFGASQYYHDEKEGNSEPINIFKNKAKNVRLEFVHKPIADWRGVWGVQYQTQTSSAYVPRLTNPRQPLNYAKTKMDEIIQKINGENSQALEKPKQEAPTLGGTPNVDTPELDKLIGNLYIGKKNQDSPSSDSANSSSDSTETDQAETFNSNKQTFNFFTPPSFLNLDSLTSGNTTESLPETTEENRSTTSRSLSPRAFELHQLNNTSNLDDLISGLSFHHNEDKNVSVSDDTEINKSPDETTDDNPKKQDISGLGLLDTNSLLAHIQQGSSELAKQPAPTLAPVANWEKRQIQDRSYALIENNVTQWSVFGMEQFVWRDFLFELGLRHERQKIAIDYDRALLARSKNIGISQKVQEPDLSPNKQHATSYSLATYWNFSSNYLLSLIFSHNERLPTSMELYYHGKHLATNSFEYGNKDLQKEKSNNAEIGLNYQNTHWNYTLNAYYNHFQNRIFKRTLNKEGNLSMNRYAQAKADYYGLEGKIDYQWNDNLVTGVFGDYVRGVLKDLPPLRLKDSQKNTYELAASRNAPRVPPLRLGVHFDWQITEHLRSNVRYTHAFSQHKVATLEAETQGYDQVDLGLSYQNQYRDLNYEMFVDVNNLLNAQIYSHSSYLPFVPQMGRNIVVGVNMSF